MLLQLRMVVMLIMNMIQQDYLMNTEAFNTTFALAARCVECNDTAPNVGRLRFVYPVVDGTKVNREMLACVVQLPESSCDFQIVFLQKHIVGGKRRINLNSLEMFKICKLTHLIHFKYQIPEKTKILNIKEWTLKVDDVACSNPAIKDISSQPLKLQDIETGNAMEKLTGSIGYSRWYRCRWCSTIMDGSITYTSRKLG